MTHTTAAAALDLSSLSRFDTNGLAGVFTDRRARAAKIAAQHGQDSTQWRGAQASVWRVACMLQDRGVPATNVAGWPLTRCSCGHVSYVPRDASDCIACR